MERVKSFRVESLTASPGGLWVWEFAILFEFFFYFNFNMLCRGVEW